MTNKNPHPPALGSVAKGVGIALIAITLWASTGVFISYLLTNFDIAPLTLASWRDIMVAATLFVVLAIFRPALLRIRRRDLPFFALYGLIGIALNNGLWVYSVSFNGAAVATVLIYTAPAWVALLSRPFFGETITRWKVLAVVLSLAGCVLVAGAYDSSVLSANLWGLMCGVASGIAFAAYTIFGKLSAERGHNPWTATAYSFACGAVFLALTRRPADFVSMGYAPLGWATLIFLSLVPTLLGYSLYTVSLVHLSASLVSIIATLEPVFTAIMAFVALGERLAPPQIVGSLLIIGAVLLLQRRTRLPPPPAPGA